MQGTGRGFSFRHKLGRRFEPAYPCTSLAPYKSCVKAWLLKLELFRNSPLSSNLAEKFTINGTTSKPHVLVIRVPYCSAVEPAVLEGRERCMPGPIIVLSSRDPRIAVGSSLKLHVLSRVNRYMTSPSILELNLS